MIDDFDPDKLGRVVSGSQSAIKTPNSTNDDPQYARLNVHESQWGPVIEMVDPDGTKSYHLPNEGDKRSRFVQDKDGKWQQKDETNAGWKGLVVDNVLKDKKFMTFVAIAAAGAAASAYAGGGEMAAGTVAEGGAPSSGVLSSAAPAASTAAPITTASTTATSTVPQAAAYSDVAGLQGMTQAGLSTAGPVGVGTGATTTGFVPAASWWETLMGGGKALLGNSQVMSGVVSGIGSAISANESAKAQREVAREDRDFKAAELDKERQWKARNFNVDSMPSIDWITPRKNEVPIEVDPQTVQPLVERRTTKPGILGGARGR